MDTRARRADRSRGAKAKHGLYSVADGQVGGSHRPALCKRLQWRLGSRAPRIGTRARKGGTLSIDERTTTNEVNVRCSKLTCSFMACICILEILRVAQHPRKYLARDAEISARGTDAEVRDK